MEEFKEMCMSDEEENVTRSLLVIPGISSDPYESPFEDVVEYAKDMDFSVVRLNQWSSSEDLDNKTLEDMHGMIDRALKKLDEEGYNYIGVIGKSFGGQLALTYPHNERFDFMVLWAPSIGLGNNNVDKWRSTVLGQASEATDISIDASSLEKIESPVKIIHGTNDEVVNVENSEKLVQHLRKGELLKIEGGDHSFSSKEKRLISESKGMFLFSHM
ncbi:MAG: YqiA/YcfP family alpha/beta fold hydrolase [Candidatus Nanohaloarchaea archaeon]